MTPPPLTAPSPSWSRFCLKTAGVYNVVWGLSVIISPHLLFDLCEIPRLNYPEVWQSVGMIVGVYGIGYWIASSDPRRHWPIVLVGLLGKIFGPIGFAFNLAHGTLPIRFGWTIITNDLIWWLPFAWILWDAWMHRTLYDPARLVVHRFVKETRLSASPARVFQFHEQNDALARLMPPDAPWKVVSAPGSLQPGTRVVLRGTLAGLPLEWIAVHTEYDPPRHFADVQESGPFEYWHHHHEFVDDGHGGTLLRDQVDYALPFGRLGRLLLGSMVRHKIEAMFQHRHQVTKQALEEIKE